MLSSFHTHTYLCKHADGTPLEYVQQAGKEGCSALGFSDHCPYPENTIWSFCRMNTVDLPLYKKLVDEAKEQADFPVYFGFECEWVPQYSTWFKEILIDTYQADYLALGSHWYPLGGEYEYAPTLDTQTLHRYIDYTIEAMQSGLFAFLAHPDLFLAAKDRIDGEMTACIDAIIDAAVALNIPLEINGYGLSKKMITRDYGTDYQYPVRAFWERAAEKNACIICNSDAHSPDFVLAGCRQAFQYAQYLGITPQDTAAALGFSRLEKPADETGLDTNTANGRIARRAIALGRVQGVGFRYWIVQTAPVYGVTGWVRNCPDRSVEILAEGEPADVREFLLTVEHNHPRAFISNFSVQDAPYEGCTSFSVRF